jgi:predicted small lipoprotein YifL
MLPCRFPARVLFVVGVLTLSLTACGRRGAPEPPPDPSAPKASEKPAESPGVLPSPVGTPRSRPARQGYTVPKGSFFLDPLL